MMGPVAMAAGHPARYHDAREVTAHSEHSRRVRAAEDSGDKSPKAKTGKRGTTKAGGGAAAQSEKSPAKPKAKLRRHKLRPEDEAQNDPLVIHRIKGRRSAVKRDAMPIQNVAKAEESVKAPAKMAPKALTMDDFVRAAGGEVASDKVGPEKSATSQQSVGIYALGQSHPEDDERLPMKSGKQITAEVSAVPERAPVVPVTSKKAAKANVLPEGHAAKAEIVEEAMTPMVLPTLRMKHGRVIMPKPLKGSWDVLVHQNTMADSEGLDRIQNDDDLDRMREAHLLVPLADSRSLLGNEGLPDNRRYARPWAARFAADMGRNYYARFHQPLRLNSAVRTVEYQLQLQRVNGNAAAVDGDGASPHLTGQALDFGKRGLSKLQLAWMRAYLEPMMRAGKVDVEEEFQQACFHVSVYRSYLPVVVKAKSAKVDVAKVEPPVRAAKADATER